MPPVALQVTAVLLAPVTVAVNCWIAPVCSEDEVGLIETAITGGAEATVTVAVADLLESAALVARTV